MITVRTLRLLLTSILVISVTTSATAQDGPPENPLEGAEIRAALDRAAIRFDIPHPVLYGIAYAQSRWHHDTLAEPSCGGMPPAYGVMGLRDDEYFGHSLQAGLPLGVTPGQAARDMESNVIAGAYHLASLFEGGNRDDITAWYSAIARYAGIPADQEAIRELYLDGVLTLLRQGWDYGGGAVMAANVPQVDRPALMKRLATLGVATVPDYPGASWQASPNYSSRSGTAVSAITIHDTEGEFAGSLSWLRSTQSEASAHYIIRSSDGLVVQMVAESEKAWHVRNENPYTVGIEHEGFASRPEYFTQTMYRASADLVRYLSTKYGIPLDRTRIKGHIDFRNNTHTDPGGWWDWPGYYRLIARKPSMSVTLDRFEDTVVGWWQPALSGSTVGTDAAGTRLTIGGALVYEGAGGAELRYAFSGASGGVARIFRSGHGNTSDGLLNLGASTGISLMIHGDGGRNQVELWLYDVSKGNVIVSLGTVDWQGWRRVSRPLTGLTGSGPYRFHSIVVRQTSGGARSGRLGFDALTAEAGAPSIVARTEPVEAASVPPAMALRIDQPLPPEIAGDGPVAIYSTLGARLAAYDAAPDDPVGAWLSPGIYLVDSRRGRFRLAVIP